MNKLTKFEILPPTLDVVFQALFGEVGSEKITTHFLELILNTKIENIDLSKNPIIRRKNVKDKMGILDIIAQINGKEYCNIEMQCSSKENIVERILFYWSKVYSKQIQSGDDYDKLNKTISILITNFNIEGLENLPYCTSWKIIEEKYRKTILTEKLEIYIIELPKIANINNEDDELLDWLNFLVNPKSERVLKKMKENKELKEANNKLEQISQDEKMQRIAEWRQKGIWDENTAINHAMQKGIQEGVKESKKEIAIKLLKENVDIELICKVTSLTKEEIEKIRNE